MSIELERLREVTRIAVANPGERTARYAFDTLATPQNVNALLDALNCSDKEMERMRMQHNVACGAIETMAGAFERATQRLAAITAARDEACRLYDLLLDEGLACSATIDELRTVGVL